MTPKHKDGLNLTPQERKALNDYAKLHGRTWKQQLRDAWMVAGEPGILQQLRNSPYFGPSGLRKFIVRGGKEED